MKYKFMLFNRSSLGWIKKIGHYANVNDFLDRFINVLVSLSILLLTSPVSIVLAIIIKLQDGGPIFYKGLRYGQNKNKFYMYKFRTLIPDAESLIGGQLLKPEMGFETPVGSFLRDTRLDELPQLINVLKGDMALIGPRPERPSVYDKRCKDILGYDLRFKVKPGIIGYSQLFTPHSSSKKLRSKIDNIYRKNDPEAKNNIIFIVCSLALLGVIALKKIALALLKKISIYYQVRRFSELRLFARYKLFKSHPARLLFYNNYENIKHSSNIESTPWHLTTLVFDINDKFITIISDYKFPVFESGNTEYFAKLIVYTPSYIFDRCKKKRIVYCRITSIKEIQYQHGYMDAFMYCIAYKACSDLNQYKLDRYILNKSIL